MFFDLNILVASLRGMAEVHLGGLVFFDGLSLTMIWQAEGV